MMLGEVNKSQKNRAWRTTFLASFRRWVVSESEMASERLLVEFFLRAKAILVA